MGTLLERYPGDGGNAHKLVLRRYLANFGLGGEVLPLQQISTMSGGQKCRLCLANAMYRQPHLLILDEPTSKCLHPDVVCFSCGLRISFRRFDCGQTCAISYFFLTRLASCPYLDHLDLETTEALIESIRTFKGGVLLVSHDQHLLTSVCKDLYVVENGNVEKLKHGMASEAFDAYKKAVVQGRR
jgi:ATPase subunit of ABC transporter with duplicated ATPase domains